MLKLKLTAVVLAALFLCSCGDSKKDVEIYNDMMQQLEEYEEQQVTPELFEPAGEQEKKYLSITYNSTSNYKYFEDNADAYMEKHPNVVITLDNHPDLLDYCRRFPVLLMSGQVGDIVMLPYNIKPQVLTDAYFTDLYPLMRNDPDFNPDDYFMNIVTAYETQGKLFNLCTNFVFMSYFMVRNDISPELTAAFESDAELSYNDAIRLYLKETTTTEQDRNWSFSR